MAEADIGEATGKTLTSQLATHPYLLPAPRLHRPLSVPAFPNMQQQVSEQEEERHFENEYERTRKEALERMKQEEEKRKSDEQKRMEDLRKQMEELKLREEEVWRLRRGFLWRQMML